MVDWVWLGYLIGTALQLAGVALAFWGVKIAWDEYHAEGEKFTDEPKQMLADLRLRLRQRVQPWWHRLLIRLGREVRIEGVGPRHDEAADDQRPRSGIRCTCDRQVEGHPP